MKAGVITIAGRKFAVGLFWQPSPSKAVAKSAKEAAMQPGQEADFYSIRPAAKNGRLAQFGLGTLRAGHKIGQPSAAGSLANSSPGSWAGAFRVPEGIWIVVVRDDLITPDGDELYTDEAEAMARLDQDIARGGLERIYAPKAWSVPDGDQTSLSFLLGRRADGRLQPIKIPRKPLILMGAAAAALASFVYGGVSVYQMIEDRERQAEMARFAAIETARQAAENVRDSEIERQKAAEEEFLQQAVNRAMELENQPVQILTGNEHPKVWQDAPGPEEWLNACRAAMQRVQSVALGWDFRSMTCTGGQLSVSWQRGDGPAVIPANANVDPAVTSAAAQVALEGLKPRGTQELWDQRTLTEFFLAQDWPVRLERIPDPPPPPPETGPTGMVSAKPPQPPPPWQMRKIILTTELAPWALVNQLAKIPGLILNSLSWSGNGQWTLEGVVYEKR